MIYYIIIHCIVNLIPRNTTNIFFFIRVCPLIEGKKYFTASKLVSNFKVHIEFCLYIVHKSSIKAVQ